MTGSVNTRNIIVGSKENPGKVRGGCGRSFSIVDFSKKESE